jgi:maltose/maltodextrin transport system substrate-binding protein
VKKFLTFFLISLLILSASVLFATEDGKLIIWADDTRAPIFKELAKDYTEQTGIEVDVYEMPMDDINKQIITAAPAGEGPDMIVGASDWIGRLVMNGSIAQVSLPADVEKLFDPVTIEAMSYNGHLYGVPYSREGVALVYNKDLVPVPPKTWDELVEIARKITDTSIPQYGFLVQFPDPYNCFPILSALGGYVFGKNSDGSINKYDVGLGSTGMILGADLIDALIEEGLMPQQVPWETMTGLLSEGRVGMVITGPWGIPIAQKGGVNVGVAPIPTICGQKPRPFVGVSGLMINAYSPNSALINDFLFNYYISKPAMLKIFEMDPRPPAYLPAFEEVKSDPIMSAFAKSISDGVPLPNIPEMDLVWNIWTDAMTMIGNQKLQPYEALKEADEKLETLIKGEK